KQRLVQKLVPKPAIEALDKGVLRRFAGRDVVPFDLCLACPQQDGIAGQLGAIVADDHPLCIPQMCDSLAPRGGRHHFFDKRSFSAALSSMASARSFFSLPFSSWRTFSRLASDTFMPPNLFFQL